MRIVATFLSLVLTALLFMLPVSSAIYDYRTEPYSQTFSDLTTAGTSANVSLFKSIYGGDYTTLECASDLATDNCTHGYYYDATSHVVQINGFTVGGTRDLIVTYDVNALTATTALDGFLNMLPWIWYLLIIGVLAISVYVIWRREEW